jgi:hypothetical protein
VIAALFSRSPAWDDSSGIAVVDADPVVRAGVLTYRLYPWGGKGLRRSR